jgi:hypothetical protein
MKFLDLVVQNKLTEAKEEIFKCLDEVARQKLAEAKKYVAAQVYEEVEILDEAPNSNRIRMGRVVKIRRRIRRNAKGRIVVQRNIRKSALKGFRVSGNTVKRIPAIQRIQKSRKLKRYWKTKGKAKLGRTLLKRKMSMRRRKGMGLK